MRSSMSSVSANSHHRRLPTAVCVQSPSQKDSPFLSVVSVMADLAARLQKLQTPVEQEMPDMSHQMDAFLIDFGKAHLGRTYYLDTWTTDQRWVKWFIGHYQHSRNTKHRMFLHYAELKIERAELEGTTIPLTQMIEEPRPKAATKASGKPYPKPKAKSMAMGSTIIEPMPETEWVRDPEDFMLVQQELAAEYPDVQHLETRMLHMENALTQVIAHLEKITTNMEPKHPTEEK